MILCRLTVLLGLLVFVGVPIAMPVVRLAGDAAAWTVLTESNRLGHLYWTSMLFVGGTVLTAVPLGGSLALLLERTDLPGRRWLRLLLVATLFVPLPLTASAWQAALGSGGWLAQTAWTTSLPTTPGRSPLILWKPWAIGLGPAIWVQVTASVPWVVLLLGAAVKRSLRDIEEEAFQLGGPWAVVTSAVWPQCRGAVVAAGALTAILAGTEITVTDMFQVRAFAEEVYTQWNTDMASVPRVVITLLPVLGLGWALAFWLVAKQERWWPNPGVEERPSLVYQLGRCRWLAFIVVGLPISVIGIVPTGTLIWKAGCSAQGWTFRELSRHLQLAWHSNGQLLLLSIGSAAAAGVVAACAALLLAWVTRDSPWLSWLTLGVLTAALVWPAPLIGWGLVETIQWLLDLSDSRWLAKALYLGPSPLPTFWACVIRFLPVAYGVVWPAVRQIPSELRDAVRIENGQELTELVRLVIPLTVRSTLAAALATTILALGELGASRLVTPPGPESETFVQLVFAQMHYGVTADLAALCLLLLGVVFLGAGGCQLMQQRDEKDRTVPIG